LIATNYTPADLKKLPLRAIVALAARCARRVEPQALLPDDHPHRDRCRKAVADAIGLAESFAKGLPCAALEAAVREVDQCRTDAAGDFVRESAMGAAVMAAHAAAAAVHALALRGEPPEPHSLGSAKPSPFPQLAEFTADLAAREAFLAASEAVGALGHTNAFVASAVEDYQKLLRLDLGSFPDAGKPIDLSSKDSFSVEDYRR
jgi:hypothetical protein